MTRVLGSHPPLPKQRCRFGRKSWIHPRTRAQFYLLPWVATSTLETISVDTLEDGWQHVRGRSWNKRLARLCIWGADTKPLKGWFVEYPLWLRRGSRVQQRKGRIRIDLE
jgi:hypothetical protein